MDSSVGLIIQFVGISLVALLSFFVGRTIRRSPLDLWTAAWLCLSFSLAVLYVGFKVSTFPSVFYALYLFGEYAYGYLFVAGCRSHRTGTRLRRRDYLALTGAAIAAIALSQVSTDFNIIFSVHAGLMAGLFGAALYSLRPLEKWTGSGPGLRVMSVALALLAIDFLHYIPVFAEALSSRSPVLSSYLKYTSIYDLFLEMLLGFGTIMVVMEDVRRELEVTNSELAAARDKLEVLASIDSLTGALNRHAFSSLIARGTATLSGWAAVLDVDNLKSINDSLGHGAGDAALREVATAIRSMIRASDQLYRWGGDEYLILLFEIPEDAVRRRIEGLNGMLARVALPGRDEPVMLNVSYGLSSFSKTPDIEQAIEQADRAMYACKQERRRASDRANSAAGSDGLDLSTIGNSGRLN